MRVSRLGAISLLAAGLLELGCAGAREEHRDVPLVWVTDQESPVTGMVNYAPHRFKILPFTDSRPDKSVIGINTKDPAKPLKVTTKDDVDAWSLDRFAYVLKRQGLEIVESGETHTIQGEILKLLVTEEGLFNGDVEFSVTVKNARGEVAWHGAVAGRSKRMGRTYKLENYYETITNAFEQAAAQLATNPGFVASLAK
jgi:hypothetical protein